MAVVRFALYVDLMLLFGLPAFLLYNERETAAFETGFTRIVRVLAFLAPVISILGFAALCANMASLALTDLDRATVEAVLWQTPIGTAWIVRMIALVAYLAIVVLPSELGSIRSVLLAAIGAIALGSLAWTGHGAAGGWTRLFADIIHLLSAGLWVGALSAFALLLTHIRGFAQGTNLLAVMLSRFALIGSLAVGAIVASGMVNGWDLVGAEHIADLWRSQYGRVLSIKLLAFAGMLGLAAANRFRLTPQLECSLVSVHQGKAAALLRKSIVIEAALALVVLALVAYLGLLEPPNAAS